MTQSVCWECGDATLFSSQWLSSRVKQTLCKYALPGDKHLTRASLAPLHTNISQHLTAFALGLNSARSTWVVAPLLPLCFEFILLTLESLGEVWDSAVLLSDCLNN